jgi:FtsH-binding integral membrane protein
VTTKQEREAASVAARRQSIARVRRNFWVLVAATILAVGVLSQALKNPNSSTTAAVVAVSGLAALVSLTLAGRILAVTTAARRNRPALRRRVRRR